MIDILEKYPFILMEGAVVERLRRTPGIELHPTLSNAPLIYSEKGKEALTKIFKSYIDIASQANIPFLMCAPTWRANSERVRQSLINDSINQDALFFMQSIQKLYANLLIKVGGIMGPKNDCYKPEEGLSITEAELFHEWQAIQIQKGDADFIIAQTLPNVEEAIGLANAISKTKLPYFISFVIGKDGCVLDGTPLENAITKIDKESITKPIGYFVNCSYPTFLNTPDCSTIIKRRLLGFLANASSKEHHELDDSKELHSNLVSDWGKEMLKLNQELNVSILGGCCGTNMEHLQYLVDNKLTSGKYPQGKPTRC